MTDTLTEQLTRAFRDGVTADDLVALRIAVSHEAVYEVHNALTTAIEVVFGEKATS